MEQRSFVDGHPVNETIRNLLGLFAEDRLVTAKEALPTDVQDNITRIELAVRQIRDMLSSSSDYDVSPTGLNNLQSHFQNVWTELNAFLSNNNAGHVTNASSNLDGALQTAAWTFLKRTSKGSKAFGETLASVQEAGRAAVDSVKVRTEALGNQVNAISASVEELRAKANEAQDGVSNAQRDISDQLATLQTQFAQIAAEAQTTWANEKAERDADLNSFLKKAESSANARVKALEGLEGQARKIVQIIGNIGLTGNYQSRALEETSQANAWRYVTIALFAIGVIMVIVNLVMNFNGQISLQLLLARFGIAVTIALPALYTARESARHRSNADRAKQTELELASLKPFLESLNTEERNAILMRLAPQYFGRDVEDHKVESPIDPNRALDAIAKISEKIPSVGK